MSRRTLLRYGIAGSVLLGIGGVGWGLRRGPTLHPPQPLKVLDNPSYTTLVAVADRLCANEEGLPTAQEIGVAEQIDALLASMDDRDARDLLRVLRWLESPLSGLTFRRGGRPFSACSAIAQDQILERWRTSRWLVQRTAFDALHALCQAPYWAHPDLWGHVGYEGPPDFSALLGDSP